jgi:hypothetical protein
MAIDRTKVHLGLAEIGLALTAGANRDPQGFQKMLEACSDDEFIGLVSHMATLQGTLDRALALFYAESERRGIEE